MANGRNIASQLKAFKNDTGGNVALIAAAAIPVLIIAVGMSLDTSYMVSNKIRLQSAADAASTAAASALANNDTMTLAQAEALATNYVNAEMKGANITLPDGCISAEATETSSYGNAKSYDVKVNICADMQFTGFTSFFGYDGTTLSVVSVAQSANATQNAMSMYLVLDRSGSMSEDTDTVASTYTYSYNCGNNGSYNGKSKGKNYGKGAAKCTGTGYNYVSKIDALKDAAYTLLDQIAEADPDKMYARLAAISYSSYAYWPEDFSWGGDNVADYVGDLEASGGTDSSYAVRQAYWDLTDGTEETAHASKNGKEPDKYIVFMTDGNNNYSSADTATKSWCDKAKDEGIEIFTIAFMAPSGGQKLLSYCATDDDHYFSADDAEEMVAAFKYIGEKATDRMTALTQ